MKLLELKEPRPGQTKIISENPIMLQTNLEGILVSYMPMPLFDDYILRHIEGKNLKKGDFL